VAGQLSGYSFQVALDGSGGLAFSDLRGLFVKFPAMDFGQGACLFDATLETAQGNVKRLVFFYSYCRHVVSRSL